MKKVVKAVALAAMLALLISSNPLGRTVGRGEYPTSQHLNIHELMQMSDEQKLVVIQHLTEVAGSLSDSFDPFKGQSGHEILQTLQKWDNHPVRQSEPQNKASIVLVMCEDNRLDESRIMRLPLGNGVAYTVKMAGGVPSDEQIEESICLPFEEVLKSASSLEGDGIKLILFLSHDKCGQQKIFDIAKNDGDLAQRFNRCSLCKLNEESVRMFIISSQLLREKATSGEVCIAYGNITTDTLDWRLIREFAPEDFER